MEAAPASGGPDGLLAVALGTTELGDELLAGLGPLERGLGGGVEQPGLIAAGVGSDGLTGGDQGVHHGLVPHLGAGHVAEGLRALAKMAWMPAVSISFPSGASSWRPSSQVFHRGTALAAVQDHDSHGRIVQHGLDAAL